MLLYKTRKEEDEENLKIYNRQHLRAHKTNLKAHQ